MRDRRLETLLRRAEESVAALRTHLEKQEKDSPSAAWFGRMGGVLSEIEDRGGEVSVEDLREIGIRHGYDPRGMGGFLSGLSPPWSGTTLTAMSEGSPSSGRSGRLRGESSTRGGRGRRPKRRTHRKLMDFADAVVAGHPMLLARRPAARTVGAAEEIDSYSSITAGP